MADQQRAARDNARDAKNEKDCPGWINKPYSPDGSYKCDRTDTTAGCRFQHRPDCELDRKVKMNGESKADGCKHAPSKCPDGIHRMAPTHNTTGAAGGNKVEVKHDDVPAGHTRNDTIKSVEQSSPLRITISPKNGVTDPLITPKGDRSDQADSPVNRLYDDYGNTRIVKPKSQPIHAGTQPPVLVSGNAAPQVEVKVVSPAPTLADYGLAATVNVPERKAEKKARHPVANQNPPALEVQDGEAKVSAGPHVPPNGSTYYTTDGKTAYPIVTEHVPWYYDDAGAKELKRFYPGRRFVPRIPPGAGHNPVLHPALRYDRDQRRKYIDETIQRVYGNPANFNVVEVGASNYVNENYHAMMPKVDVGDYCRHFHDEPHEMKYQPMIGAQDGDNKDSDPANVSVLGRQPHRRRGCEHAGPWFNKESKQWQVCPCLGRDEVDMVVSNSVYLSKEQACRLALSNQSNKYVFAVLNFNGSSGEVLGAQWARNADGSIDMTIPHSHTVYIDNDVGWHRPSVFRFYDDVTGRETYFNLSVFGTSETRFSAVWCLTALVGVHKETTPAAHTSIMAAFEDRSYVGPINRSLNRESSVETDLATIKILDEIGAAPNTNAYMVRTEANAAQKNGNGVMTELIYAAKGQIARKGRMIVNMNAATAVAGTSAFKAMDIDRIRNMTVASVEQVTKLNLGYLTHAVAHNCVRLAAVLATQTETVTAGNALGRVGGNLGCIQRCCRRYEIAQHRSVIANDSCCEALTSYSWWFWLTFGGFALCAMIFLMRLGWALAYMSLTSKIAPFDVRMMAGYVNPNGSDNTVSFGTYNATHVVSSFEPEMPPSKIEPNCTIQRAMFSKYRTACDTVVMMPWFKNTCPTIVRSTSNTEYDGILTRCVAELPYKHEYMIAALPTAMLELCNVVFHNDYGTLPDRQWAFEPWLTRPHHYTATVQEQFREVHKNRYNYTLKEFLRVQANLKIEKTFGKKAGRIIFASSPINNVIMGPIQCGYKDILKKLDKLLIYVPGKDPVDLATAYYASDGPTVLESDCSRFDANFNEAMFEAEMMLLKYLGADNIKTPLGTAMHLFRAMKLTKGRGLNGTRFKALFKRSSGRTNTTDGNTVLIKLMQVMSLAYSHKTTITRLLTGRDPQPRLVVSHPGCGKTTGLTPFKDFDSLISNDIRFDPLKPIDSPLWDIVAVKAAFALSTQNNTVIAAIPPERYGDYNIDGFYFGFDDNTRAAFYARSGGVKYIVDKTADAWSRQHLEKMKQLARKGGKVVVYYDGHKQGCKASPPVIFSCGDDSLIRTDATCDVKRFEHAMRLMGNKLKMEHRVDIETATLISARPYRCDVDDIPAQSFGIKAGRYFSRIPYCTQLRVKRGEHINQYVRGVASGLWANNSMVPFVRVHLAWLLRMTAGLNARYPKDYAHKMTRTKRKLTTSNATWAQFEKIYGVNEADERSFEKWLNKRDLTIQQWEHPAIERIISVDIVDRNVWASFTLDADVALMYQCFGLKAAQYVEAKHDDPERDEEKAKRAGIDIGLMESLMELRKDSALSQIPFMVEVSNARAVTRMTLHNTLRDSFDLETAITLHKQLNAKIRNQTDHSDIIPWFYEQCYKAGVELVPPSDAQLSKLEKCQRIAAFDKPAKEKLHDSVMVVWQALINLLAGKHQPYTTQPIRGMAPAGFGEPIKQHSGTISNNKRSMSHAQTRQKTEKRRPQERRPQGRPRGRPSQKQKQNNAPRRQTTPQARSPTGHNNLTERKSGGKSNRSTDVIGTPSAVGSIATSKETKPIYFERKEFVTDVYASDVDTVSNFLIGPGNSDLTPIFCDEAVGNYSKVEMVQSYMEYAPSSGTDVSCDVTCAASGDASLPGPKSVKEVAGIDTSITMPAYQGGEFDLLPHKNADSYREKNLTDTTDDPSVGAALGSEWAQDAATILSGLGSIAIGAGMFLAEGMTGMTVGHEVKHNYRRGKDATDIKKRYPVPNVSQRKMTSDDEPRLIGKMYIHYVYKATEPIHEINTLEDGVSYFATCPDQTAIRTSGAAGTPKPFEVEQSFSDEGSTNDLKIAYHWNDAIDAAEFKFSRPGRYAFGGTMTASHPTDVAYASVATTTFFGTGTTGVRVEAGDSAKIVAPWPGPYALGGTNGCSAEWMGSGVPPRLGVDPLGSTDIGIISPGSMNSRSYGARISGMVDVIDSTTGFLRVYTNGQMLLGTPTDWDGSISGLPGIMDATSIWFVRVSDPLTTPQMLAGAGCACPGLQSSHGIVLIRDSIRLSMKQRAIREAQFTAQSIHTTFASLAALGKAAHTLGKQREHVNVEIAVGEALNGDDGVVVKRTDALSTDSKQDVKTPQVAAKSQPSGGAKPAAQVAPAKAKAQVAQAARDLGTANLTGWFSRTTNQ